MVGGISNPYMQVERLATKLPAEASAATSRLLYQTVRRHQRPQRSERSSRSVVRYPSPATTQRSDQPQLLYQTGTKAPATTAQRAKLAERGPALLTSDHTAQRPADSCTRPYEGTSDHSAASEARGAWSGTPHQRPRAKPASRMRVVRPEMYKDRGCFGTPILMHLHKGLIRRRCIKEYA